MAVKDQLSRVMKPVELYEDDQESFHTGSEDVLSNAEGIASDSDEIEEDISVESQDEDVNHQLNAVSFGALKKANDSLARKRKASDEYGPDQEAKLESLKKRLQLIKDQKQKSGHIIKSRQGSSKQHQDIPRVQEDNDSDSDSGPEQQTTQGRAKHAPAAQSSKYQVSRKRQVVEVPKNQARDPRFGGNKGDATIADHREKAYSFLQDYQKSEILELKAAIKTTKSQDEKDLLRRRVNAMENRLKAKVAKDRERDIIRKHRKEESTQVSEGKTPYYLKRGEIKQRALVDKFESMKSKDRERLIERRRKKDSQKQKKMMPDFRRGIPG